MKKLLPAFTAILFTLSARASRAEAEQPLSPKAKERFGDAGNVVIPVTPQSAADATTWAATDNIKVTSPLTSQPGPGQATIGSLNLAAATTVDFSGVGAPVS